MVKTGNCDVVRPPGNSSADEENSTQSPVSKLAALQEEFALQRSMQSVSMRVPGRESSMSSGAVKTLPVTSSKWMLSTGLEQKLDWADERRGKARRIPTDFMFSGLIFGSNHFSNVLT